MNRYQLLCILYVTFGSFFYGYDSGVTTSILGYSRFLEYFDLNATTIGAFNSVYYGGIFVGCTLNWFLPDRIGRLRTIQLSCVIAIAGISMQTGATSFGVLLAGRVVGGVASGMIFSICPAYASEISPPELRGSVAGIYGFNVNFAYMVTEWLGLAFYFIPSDVSWRLLLGLQLVPAFAMLIGSYWMPFSPRWLCLKGRYDEALDVLKRMHGGMHDETFYLREYHQIKSQIELAANEKISIIGIIKEKSYRKRLGIVVFTAVFQQLTGIIAIQNYQVVIYQSLKFSNIMALILTGVYGTVATTSAAIATVLCDRIGRRKLIFLAYSFMIPAGLAFVILWSQFEATGGTNIALGKGMVFCIYWFSMGFSGPINCFWAVYPSEILPTRIRTFGVASSYMIFSSLTIMLVQVTPLALATISWHFFLIFLIMNCIFVVGFYFFCPETRLKTLEEIEAIFGDEVAETLEEAAKHVTSINGSKKDLREGLKHKDAISEV